MWPLLEELSADEDEGAEEELQDPKQEVNRLNGKGISACISSHDDNAVPEIGADLSSKLKQLSMPVEEFNQLIDRQLKVLKVHVLQ